MTPFCEPEKELTDAGGWKIQDLILQRLDKFGVVSMGGPGNSHAFETITRFGIDHGEMWQVLYVV